jgi:hypothetical protein
VAVVAVSRGRDVRRALVLVAAAFLVYNANGRAIATGDTFPAR